MKWVRFGFGMLLVLGLLAVTVDIALRLGGDDTASSAAATTTVAATSSTGPADTSDLPVRPVNAPLPAPGLGGASTAAAVASTGSSTSAAGATAPASGISALTGSVAKPATNVSADGTTLTFQGVTYSCAQAVSSATYHSCAPKSAASGTAKIWCNTSTCLPYDPSAYAEVGYRGARYLCQHEAAGGRWSCGAYAGGPAVAALFTTPSLRCEGTAPSLQCSDLWYPSVLNTYDSFANQGTTYLCRAATGAGPDDWDCGPYTGGDPVRSVSFGQLRCTRRSGTFTCNAAYYPSERDGIEALTIQGVTHACTRSAAGLSCYPWTGSGSPKAAIVGTPAWYCNDIGCAKDAFPSAPGTSASSSTSTSSPSG